MVRILAHDPLSGSPRFPQALGWLWGSLEVALGWLLGAYRLTTKWL
jgi:hypothetical protein